MVENILLPNGLQLRLIQAEDSVFLRELFKSAREHLLQLPLPAAQLELLVTQQFILQQNSYTSQFPGASTFIVLLNASPIGKLTLDELGAAVHIVDLSLVANERNRGYGKSIIRSLQNYAADKNARVMLSVDVQNIAAKRLYLSLGFSVRALTSTHESMQWQADTELNF
jgi:ribosomal protein S18 acetylase RimI-like enzyme